VPSLSEWLAADALGQQHAQLDLTAAVEEYAATYQVALEVVDGLGQLVVPPAAHVWDALARAWLDVENDDVRAAPGTVAVVARFPDCSSCGARARYDTTPPEAVRVLAVASAADHGTQPVHLDRKTLDGFRN